MVYIYNYIMVYIV